MGVELVCRKESGTVLRLTGWIGDEADSESIWLRDIVAHLEGTTAPATLRLSSRGGFLGEALAIRQYLRTRETDTTVVVEVCAASSATIIALGAKRIEIERGSFWMMHSPGGFSRGTDECIGELLLSLESRTIAVAHHYALKTGRSASSEMRRLIEGERWMTAEQAVAQGYADTVISPHWSRVSPAKVP